MKLENVAAATSVLTETALCNWLGEASPGDIRVYHRGHLALDCSPTTGRRTKREQAELVRVARRARFAQENGLAFLMQLRHGADDYTYVIVARSRCQPDRFTAQAAVQAQGGIP